MKLWIFLALVGVAAAAPMQGKSISIKKYDADLGCWVVVGKVTDQARMKSIVEKQGDNINRVYGSDAPCVGEVAIGPCLGDLAEPEVTVPCGCVDAEAQTKVVQRKPCFSKFAPVVLDVDGQKWRCTLVGRTASPCLPEGRVVGRACGKTIAPKPEIVIVDQCDEDEKVVEPCVSASSSSSVSHEVKIEQPCVVRTPEPCVVETKEVAPCVDIKLPEVKISASASASASSLIDTPKLDTVLGAIEDKVGGFSVSASASASASHSSSARSSSSFSIDTKCE